MPAPPILERKAGERLNGGVWLGSSACRLLPGQGEGPRGERRVRTVARSARRRRAISVQLEAVI
ncbi:hypothetical protein GCM10010191_40970 [Actinomadura vinacea]|uniref:Uncharacterized protein n=1 Tax=Actinomadura vinacea TaxID=115336 RepID=A0ABN3JAB1_9ACTN